MSQYTPAESLALDSFTDYMVRNYPGPDTIISDPTWHAPRIFRAARHALSTANAAATLRQAARVDTAMVERACLAYIAADLHLLAGAVDLMRDPMRAALEAALSAPEPAAQGEAVPNDDGGHEQAKAHGLFIYEVDFGDEGKGRYIRLRDFNAIVDKLNSPAPAASPAVVPDALRVWAMAADAPAGDPMYEAARGHVREMLAAAPSAPQRVE
jgi:hypothetical protein